MNNNVIIIQDDGTPRLAICRPGRNVARWFDNGEFYNQAVAEENTFPVTTEGLQEAMQRHIAVRHKELLDNHLDNPASEAIDAELRVYERLNNAA